MADTTADLATIIRAGNYPKLNDELARWRPSEIATALTDLHDDEPGDRVSDSPATLGGIGVRVHPRHSQRALVKAMGDEDVAELLNHMAPDDRTLFLSELPANVTKELLTLLTDEERAEAVTLLGYAAGTVGRLMTPHYIAVKENWTVQHVLDYVRERGENSETLNVVYVVDDEGVLIDDIRTRNFLVAPLTKRVSDFSDPERVPVSVLAQVAGRAAAPIGRATACRCRGCCAR